MDRYYQILEYEMSQLEAKAFRLALIWEELAHEYFPTERCGKLPTKGDPRKSDLFRHCRKLAITTKGLVLDDQYPWYLRAQFDILKNLKNEGQHANICPSCMVGDKAWKRWKVWLKKFNSVSKVDKSVITISESKIIVKLNKTKEFLEKQFKGYPKFSDIEAAFKNRTIIRWVTVGKICGYYVILSPFIKKCLDGKNFEELFLFDLGIYKTCISPGVEEHFRREFSQEYDI